MSVIGVDIGSSSIKIVQLAKKGGQAILETYGELSLGPYAGVEVGQATSLPPEKVAEALIDVIRESKATATSAGVAIPFSSSLITPIEMPAQAENQFAEVVPIEARKYVPVPISEVTLDWWIIPKVNGRSSSFSDVPEKADQNEKLEVLLVAIHNDAITRFQTIVNKASLQTSFFEIEIFSTIRSVADQGLTSQMIIDIGSASTKIYIVEQGIVRSSHVVNRGAQDVTLALSRSLGVSVQTAEIMKRNMDQIMPDKKNDAASVISLTLDHVFTEAHQVMLNYQRRFNKDVPKAIIVGGGAMLKGILSYAEIRLQTSVSLGDPFGRTQSPSFLGEVLKTTGPEFAVAVGVALRKLTELQ